MSTENDRRSFFLRQCGLEFVGSGVHLGNLRMTKLDGTQVTDPNVMLDHLVSSWNAIFDKIEHDLKKRGWNQ